MARHVLLNNIDHRHVRIDTTRSAALGDAVMYALAVPSEFRSLQAHYPLVFIRDTQAQWQPVALFGFKPGQNLFLGEQGWDAYTLPHIIERQPFAIGTQGDEPMIHLDLDSPRVRGDHGQSLFLDHGGTTAYLDRINSVLRALGDGIAQLPAFIALLEEYRLLEPFVLDFQLDDGSQQQLAGFHAIHEERLAALDAGALQRFQSAGFLLPLYMVVASMSNFRDLIARANRVHGDRG